MDARRPVPIPFFALFRDAGTRDPGTASEGGQAGGVEYHQPWLRRTDRQTARHPPDISRRRFSRTITERLRVYTARSQVQPLSNLPALTQELFEFLECRKRRR